MSWPFNARGLVQGPKAGCPPHSLSQPSRASSAQPGCASHTVRQGTPCAYLVTSPSLKLMLHYHLQLQLWFVLKWHSWLSTKPPAAMHVSVREHMPWGGP